MLPVKFRHHQTTYLSHVVSVVNISIIRVRWKYQVHIHKAQLFKCLECLVEYSSKYFVSQPSAKTNKEQQKQCTYQVKFRLVFVPIVAEKNNKY